MSGKLLATSRVGGALRWSRPIYARGAEYQHAIYTYSLVDKFRAAYSFYGKKWSITCAATDAVVNSAKDSLTAEIRADYAINAAHTLFSTASAGKDWEAAPDGRLFEYDIRVYQMGWRYQLGDRLGFTGAVMYQTIGAQSTRSGGQIGIRLHY